MITNFLNKLRAPTPKRPTAKLVSKTETFTLSPGRLMADLELTPQREDELLKRKAQIEKDAAANANFATKTRDKVVAEANTVCSGILEETERNKRKLLRKLYAEYMEISEETQQASLGVAHAQNAATPPVVSQGTSMSSIAQQAAAGQGQRRRVPTVMKPAETVLGDGSPAVVKSIPDKVEEIVREQREVAQS